jgi:hypothetical protein
MGLNGRALLCLLCTWMGTRMLPHTATRLTCHECTVHQSCDLRVPSSKADEKSNADAVQSAAKTQRLLSPLTAIARLGDRLQPCNCHPRFGPHYFASLSLLQHSKSGCKSVELSNSASTSVRPGAARRLHLINCNCCTGNETVAIASTHCTAE